MPRCKYYEKKNIYGNISLVIALWADIFIACIALNPVSTFRCHFYPGNLANFAVSIIISFFITTLTIRWFGQIVALPRWTWLLLLLSYFFIDSCSWWYLLSSSSPKFFDLILLYQIYESLVHWDICVFLGNCCREFSQNFFEIRWVILTVKKITVKVK